MKPQRILSILVAIVPAAACGGSAPKPVSSAQAPAHAPAGGTARPQPAPSAASTGELQFEQPDGADPATRAVRTVKTRGDLVFHELEISGTYVAEMMSAATMTAGERVNKPNWRMLAAVVETPQGPYYVKLVGPDATVQRWKESYQAFLQAIRT